GPGQVQYLVVGNAVMTCVVEAMMVVASSGWERKLGTVPLLVASPAGLIWVYAGRSLQWPVSGAGTSLVALLVLGPAFGVSWTAGRVLPVVLLVLVASFTTYCVGLLLGAMIFNARDLRSVVSNGASFGMMVVCGVQVPVDTWPGWVQGFAAALPLTHALAAIRTVAAGGAAAGAAREAGLALALGAVWLAAAAAVLRIQVARGRRAGTIDFGE
ncbi:MAG TPA: ABC transporter permease, partial [Micromonosporaceae bacterium]|nr:ABC transporter permease [Micromonosporaceae bacterium]